jgi:hypothetical protein
LNPIIFGDDLQLSCTGEEIGYGEYPYVSGEEIKKALKLKNAFSEMLYQMQSPNPFFRLI